MQRRSIAAMRMANQLIELSTFERVAGVVAHLTAIQAQDYRGALWSIGLRLPGSTTADVELALRERAIVRTWPMRGTLHFVAAADVRWMLRLLTPRVIKGNAGRERQLELDAKVFAKSRRLFVKALQGGVVLTRPEMYAVLERARIPAANQRGIHILLRLSQEGLLCFAPHRGNQPSFALLDEWIPESGTLEHEEALAELALRYFRGHGPATLRDLAWWAGLTLGDARLAVAGAGSALESATAKKISYFVARDAPSPRKTKRAVHLLPGFDEYLLGYADRSVALDAIHSQAIVPGNNGMFMPTIVAGGRVVGTWRARAVKGNARVELAPFGEISATDARSVARTVARYERFIASPERG